MMEPTLEELLNYVITYAYANGKITDSQADALEMKYLEDWAEN